MRFGQKEFLKNAPYAASIVDKASPRVSISRIIKPIKK
jgi:hypothetical protein